MRKIFGVLSLTAILMVAFTSKASANSGQNTDNIEFSVSFETDLVFVNGVVNTIENVFLYVTVESVNYLTFGGVVDKPDIGSNKLFYNTFKTETTNIWKDLPIKVGWTIENSNTINKIKDSIIVRKDLPFEVGWCN
jgi:hypothetical protein